MKTIGRRGFFRLALGALGIASSLGVPDLLLTRPRKVLGVWKWKWGCAPPNSKWELVEWNDDLSRAARQKGSVVLRREDGTIQCVVTMEQDYTLAS